MGESIRDDIEAAFNSANGKEGGVDNSSVIDKLEPKEPEAKAEEPEQKEPEPKVGEPEPKAGESEQGGTWNPDKAPTSWSPKMREKWSSLDPDVRKEIVRREEASVVGVRKLQEEFQPIRRFAESLSPFIQEARQLGADPGQYMQRVMSAERELRSQDPNQRFNALLNIADTYGIPIRQYLGGQAPQQQQQQAVPPALQQELAAMRQWREQQEQQTIAQQIESFRKDKEFFDDVRGRMADLMDSGAAKTLDEAYETAIWANPEIRSVLLSRQEQERSKSKLNQRQAAAATASVRGSSSDIQVEDEDDSIEAIIRRAASERL